MKRFFPLLLLFSLLVSCKNGELFNEQHTIKNSVWNRFEAETFEFESTNSDDFYNLYLYAEIDTTQYLARTLPLNINLYSSNGERRMFTATITLRDSHGASKGTLLDNGNIFAEQCARKMFCFNSVGHYTLELGQATHYYDIRGIKKIGVRIENAPLEYPE